LEHILLCADAFAEMERVSKITSTKPGQSYHHADGVKTGTLVMEPAARELASVASRRILHAISGGNVPNIRAEVHGGNAAGIEKIHDGNLKSYWHAGAYQKIGDWYALDFGTVLPLRSVDLLLGRNDKDTDFIKSAQLEFSTDGNTWQALGPPVSGMRLRWQGKAVVARTVRCRLLDVQYPPGGSNPVWTAIREFSVNQVPPPMAESTIPGLTNLQVEVTEKLIRIAEGLEVVKMPAGATLALVFPQPVDATWVEVNFDDPRGGQWAEVMLELGDGRCLRPLPMQAQVNNLVNANAHKGVRRMLLRNKDAAAKDIKLRMFKVDATTPDPAKTEAALRDSNLLTAFAGAPASVTTMAVDDPRATRVIVIGRAPCVLEAESAAGWKTLGEHSGSSGFSQHSLPAGTRNLRVGCLPRSNPRAGIAEILITR
jgi:hyaluronoglucosaminidase